MIAEGWRRRLDACMIVDIGREYPINRMIGDDEVDANGRDVESVLTAREAEW